MLSVENLSASYGRVKALHDVSLEVQENLIVTLIGSNGAGKSTLLRVISGLLKPTSGRIIYMGDRLDGLAPDRIIAKGLAHCPEGRRIFAELSVAENLEMGAFLEKSKSKVKRKIEEIYHAFPILRSRAKQMAGTMSGGEQQQLAIARALMMDPRIILFDEPSLGLSPLMVEMVEEIIIKLKGNGITILLVEQNASLALRIADYGYVIETGRIMTQGPSADLRNDPQVIRAYLGG